MANPLTVTAAPETAPDEQGSPAAFGVRDLREEMGLTQLAFGELIGLANKASVSLLESGQREASAQVALVIERLSIRPDRNGGAPRIDAGTLCEVVRLSRESCPGGCGFEIPSHDAANTAAGEGSATGKVGEVSGDPAPQVAA